MEVLVGGVFVLLGVALTVRGHADRRGEQPRGVFGSPHLRFLDDPLYDKHSWFHASMRMVVGVVFIVGGLIVTVVRLTAAT